MAVCGRDDQRHPGRLGQNISRLRGEAGQIATLKQARTRERRRQQEIGLDLTSHVVGERVSVADQCLPGRLPIIASDPCHHDQREDGQGQDADQRPHAQPPAQRTGPGHDAGPVSQIFRKGERRLLGETYEASCRPQRVDALLEPQHETLTRPIRTASRRGRSPAANAVQDVLPPSPHPPREASGSTLKRRAESAAAFAPMPMTILP